MDKGEAKFFKERIKHEVTKGQHDRDMFDVDRHMDNILECFSKQITWSNISPKPDEQLTYLQDVIKAVKIIARRTQND